MTRPFNEVPLDQVAGEEKPKKCPECGSTKFSYEDGERFCKKCGLVVE